MGRAVDKFVPLVLGAFAGVFLAFRAISWNSFALDSDLDVSGNGNGNGNGLTNMFPEFTTDWSSVVLAVVISLGGGTAFSHRAPVSEVSDATKLCTNHSDQWIDIDGCMHAKQSFILIYITSLAQFNSFFKKRFS